MKKFRIDFTCTSPDFTVGPLVTEAEDRTELALNIGDHVNHGRRDIVGGDVDDDMLGGYVTGENGEDYGTFTVTEL